MVFPFPISIRKKSAKYTSSKTQKYFTPVPIMRAKTDSRTREGAAGVNIIKFLPILNYLFEDCVLDPKLHMIPKSTRLE